MRGGLAPLAILLCLGCAAPPPSTIRHSMTKQPRVPAMLACDRPADCYVRPRSCCGMCGAATWRDSIAINRAWAAENQYACTGGPNCGDCFQEQDPGLIATCDRGRCRTVDISRLPLTRCARDDECRIRAAPCCECEAHQWVSVRRDALDGYARLVCGASTVCPGCVSNMPANLIPACQAGRCAVRSIGRDAE